MSRNRIDLDRYMAATRQHGERPVTLEANVAVIMCVVANLQLALRHPMNLGSSAQVTREFVGHMSEILGTLDPVFAEVIAQGTDPCHDIAVIEAACMSAPARPAQSWQKGEPPHDRPIVIIANLVWNDDEQGYSKPVLMQAQWGEHCQEWLDDHGLVIRNHIEEQLVIHWWADLPNEEPTPEVTVSAIVETLSDGSRLAHPIGGVA